MRYHVIIRHENKPDALRRLIDQLANQRTDARPVDVTVFDNASRASLQVVELRIKQLPWVDLLKLERRHKAADLWQLWNRMLRAGSKSSAGLVVFLDATSQIAANFFDLLEAYWPSVAGPNTAALHLVADDRHQAGEFSETDLPLSQFVCAAPFFSAAGVLNNTDQPRLTLAQTIIGRGFKLWSPSNSMIRAAQAVNPDPVAPSQATPPTPPQPASAPGSVLASAAETPAAEASIPVSVVMAVHNTRPDWLRMAVGSVWAQTVRPAELILIDDGSTDPATIAELALLAPLCRLIRLPHNIGAGPARNEALRAASADLVAIMDSDDIAKPHWLETMLRRHLEYRDADIISPAADFMNGREAVKAPAVVTFETMGKTRWVACHPGMLYRRAPALAAGGYGTTTTASDLSLWRRMLSRGSILHNVPDKLIHYRVHPGQLTNREDRQRNFDAVMNEPLPTRRRILVGSYFMPDANSAGGGPNIYVDEVKYLEARDDCEVKWLYALKGEMRENNVVSVDAAALRRKWKCQQVNLGDTNAVAQIIKQFKPDLIFPLGWALALDMPAAQVITKTAIPVYTRVEHVNFLSGDISLDNAQTAFTKKQHEWQSSVKGKELVAYGKSAAALCVSEDDAECLRQHLTGVPIYFVPPVVPPEKRQYNPATTSKDVVFLGGTWHRGNIDALIYFMRDVWPLVKAKSPESRVKICGVCGVGLGQWLEAKKTVDQYPGDITVLGYVEDLGDVFENIACSVVPVITGGGVKIKLQTSFSFRCPAITTPWVADEFKLGPEFSPMIGNDPADYARKILDVIQRPEKRAGLMDVIDRFNVTWGEEARNAVIDKAIPGKKKRIISAANCLTLTIADRSTHLFQARSDALVRLLGGEANTANYQELLPYFKPGMVTPLPKTLPAEWDVFFWSNMVDETTWAIDFHGWPFGPNHAYAAALKPGMEKAFWKKYNKIQKPTLEERAANYRAVNDLLVKANPNVRRIVVLYDTSRFHEVKPEVAKSFDESAAHMAEILDPLGWEIHAVPKGQAPRPTDNHWAHYGEQWTKEWLANILEGAH